MLTNILPLRMGDVARAVLIGNVPPITISRGISTMVVERILDMLFIVAIFPFTLAYVPFLEPWMQDAARGSGIAAIVGILILIVAANQRPLAGRLATQFFKRIPFLETGTWVGRIDRLLAGLDSLTRPKDGLILTVLSIVIWLPILFSYYAVLVAVGIEPTLPMVAFVVCAAAFSIAAPSSPGQIGVFHAGVIAALAMLGQPRAEAASFAFLYHLLNLLSMVVLGLIGIYATGSTWGKVIESTQAFMRRTRRNEKEERGSKKWLRIFPTVRVKRGSTRKRLSNGIIEQQTNMARREFWRYESFGPIICSIVLRYVVMISNDWKR
jgi:glycosyltransferase 2 family protein